jgi:hypothetical protein
MFNVRKVRNKTESQRPFPAFIKLPVGRFSTSTSVWYKNDDYETRWYVLKGDSTKRSTFYRPNHVFMYLAWLNYLIPIFQRLPRRGKQHRNLHPPLPPGSLLWSMLDTCIMCCLSRSICITNCCKNINQQWTLRTSYSPFPHTNSEQ